MRIQQPSVELLTITDQPLRLIERAGRTCYKSEDKITDTSAAEFVKMIMKRGHLSVIEHASATIKFVCDRGVTHELVRHRLASFSQESTRFCNYSIKSRFDDGIACIRPPIPLNNIGADDAWRSAMLSCERAYEKMIRAGCTPQIARSVLPISVKTEIVVTANFRQWLHIFELRCATAAHPQIVFLMVKARKLLADIVPEIFSDGP